MSPGVPGLPPGLAEGRDGGPRHAKEPANFCSAVASSSPLSAATAADVARMSSSGRERSRMCANAQATRSREAAAIGLPDSLPPLLDSVGPPYSLPSLLDSPPALPNSLPDSCADVRCVVSMSAAFLNAGGTRKPALARELSKVGRCSVNPACLGGASEEISLASNWKKSGAGMRAMENALARAASSAALYECIACTALLASTCPSVCPVPSACPAAPLASCCDRVDPNLEPTTG
mmetsp:Transcript_23072/g.58564  ORF Transcript_23072/g.58564 Transcript_23072/m.58564 type:complete len:235 (+) Transcript_23072:898-1602(+)